MKLYQCADKQDNLTCGKTNGNKKMEKYGKMIEDFYKEFCIYGRITKTIENNNQEKINGFLQKNDKCDYFFMQMFHVINRRKKDWHIGI